MKRVTQKSSGSGGPCSTSKLAAYPHLVISMLGIVCHHSLCDHLLRVRMRRQVAKKQMPDALLLSYRASTARDSHPGTLGLLCSSLCIRRNPIAIQYQSN